jgi:UDP-N-acetylglucosamine 2-epimerase (non-hydrolysing)
MPDLHRTLTVLNVVGARPNFMKIAPLVLAMRGRPAIRPLLVHTGQHYDARMSRLFFTELGIPEPDVNLEVGSGSHAVQTAEIMKRFEPVVERFGPDVVLVVGDVNSTIACALVAVKMGVRVAHVEAGLRSFDRSMPEEINRILTDAISEWLFVTEPSGAANLLREGIAPQKIHFVGNVMIDSLLANLAKARDRTTLEDLGLRPRGYAVVTLHRPGNVDDPRTLRGLMELLEEVSAELPVVFPAHPRTLAGLKRLGMPQAKPTPGLRLIEPLGYLDFLRLMADARVVMTDSGGIQEETTILKVPCLTLRDNTERPVTVDVGCNQLVGTQPERIRAALRRVMAAETFTCGTPEKWDGRAAARIVDVLAGATA